LGLLYIFAAGLAYEPHPSSGNGQNAPRYYSPEDFKSVEKFDIHIHINTEEEHFIKQAIEDNFRFLDIVDDRPFGLPMTEQQKLAIKHLNNYLFGGPMGPKGLG